MISMRILLTTSLILAAPGRLLNLSCRREDVYTVRSWKRPFALSFLGRIASQHVHIPMAGNVHSCAFLETSAVEYIPRHVWCVQPPYVDALSGSARWRSLPRTCGLPGSPVVYHPPPVSTRTCSHPATDIPLPLRYHWDQFLHDKTPYFPMKQRDAGGFFVAVPVGFEPTVEFPPHDFSRVAPSAARTRYRN